MKKVSDAELEVLKIIWNKKVTTSSEIIAGVKQFNWTNNTVRTLIKRLYEKEVIEVVGKKNKVYYYKAKVDEEKFKYLRIKSLLNQLFDSKIENLLQTYFKYEKKSGESKKKLLDKF